MVERSGGGLRLCGHERKQERRKGGKENEQKIPALSRTWTTNECVFGSVGLNIIGCLVFLFLSPTVLCSLYSVLLVALFLTSFFLILPHDLSHVH